MVELFFAKAKVFDLLELADGLRPLDYDEIVATAGYDVWGTLERSLDLSDDPVSVKAPNGALIAVFGLAPASLLGDTAAPWLLGTGLMTTYAKEILHHARRYIAFARERYPFLVNYVDARNEPSIRWLERIGFKIDPPAPYGVAGLPFHRFHLGFDDV